MAQAWSPAWMRRVLRLPELDTFEHKPDSFSMAMCYVDMIAAPTKTGYSYVYKVGKRFQAKLYVRPGVQRNLSSRASAKEAAADILLLAYGILPLPPSPVKDKPKISKPKRQRQAKAQRSLSPLADLLAQPVTPESLAALGSYSAPALDEDPTGLPVAAVVSPE